IATGSCHWCMEAEVEADMPVRPSPPALRFRSVRPCWLPQLRVVSQTGTATFGGVGLNGYG
ncbi:hypothetical protein EJ02DRAFT_459532, partial [Clathrospora elynae]